MHEHIGKGSEGHTLKTSVTAPGDGEISSDDCFPLGFSDVSKLSTKTCTGLVIGKSYFEKKKGI